MSDTLISFFPPITNRISSSRNRWRMVGRWERRRSGGWCASGRRRSGRNTSLLQPRGNRDSILGVSWSLGGRRWLHSNYAAAIGDAPGRDNRPRGDGIHDARDQGQRGDLPRDVAPRLDPLRDNDIDAGGCRAFGLRHGTDLVEDLHAGVMSTPHIRRRVAPEERDDGDALLQTDGNVSLDAEVQD